MGFNGDLIVIYWDSFCSNQTWKWEMLELSEGVIGKIMHKWCISQPRLIARGYVYLHCYMYMKMYVRRHMYMYVTLMHSNHMYMKM